MRINKYPKIIGSFELFLLNLLTQIDNANSADIKHRLTIMKNLEMRDYTCNDGVYRIPYICSNPYNRFSFLNSPFFDCSSEDVKIICQEGCTSLKNFEFNLGLVTNTNYDELNGIFVGIYRKGEKNPVWQEIIDEAHCSLDEISFVLNDVELESGFYFLLFGNIIPEENFNPFIREFAGCYRQDFVVAPNGLTMRHPQLMDCGIRYIDYHKREPGYPYPNPNFLMLFGDFPLYELTITLDVVPKKDIDKYDLRIFDDGLACVEVLEDIIHKSTEHILFVPPHGVPHGTGHFILYHNDIPYIHFQCNRNKRMGVLKAEPIAVDSIYWHLHRYKSLQQYGCADMKKKICKLLNNNADKRPNLLCITNDLGNNHSLRSHLVEDLYPEKRSRYLCDENISKINTEEGGSSTSKVVIWNVDETSTRLWNKCVACVENCLNADNPVIIIGTTKNITSLLDRFCSLSQRLTPDNHWHTQPYTKMERLYLTIDALSSEGEMPSFEDYEQLYDSL